MNCVDLFIADGVIRKFNQETANAFDLPLARSLTVDLKSASIACGILIGRFPCIYCNLDANTDLFLTQILLP